MLYRSIFILLSIISLVSCKKKEVNYILYYQKVNEIDSIYRLANNPKLAAEEYKKFFEAGKYEPKNQERINEYETYIILADRYNIDFGGKESLKKLIFLDAQHGGNGKKYFPLFKKYGIDSLYVKDQIANWKKSLNQTLIDSFTIAMKRDQLGRPFDSAVSMPNVRKNAKLLIWTFSKYGYPTPQKMGIMGHDDTFFAMTTFLTHMVEAKQYPFIKSKLYEYIKSGDCLPRDYALMVDVNAFLYDKEGLYRFAPGVSTDSAKINRNRKSIGLPSLKHTAALKRDFFKIL
ncbi:hypothetical protein [Chryseobacterium indologenes]|uniref:Lipoprotein n=1 Tax=Chryseobacterium indologenes TaxID=253 RepID=A0A0N0IV33_CHRID|nr:hypothetical protein [Chryseobacterium indologenes]KPE50183.1 hypothetical protein AOB46_15640 [Chryseobacterium indologenes]